jgi:hypothetical protein
MKFGDIVVNEWAGDRNPHKVLMFVRKTKRVVYCLTRDGSAVEFCNDSQLRLSKVGCANMDVWDQMIAAKAEGGR